MPTEQFIDKKFSASSEAVILEAVEGILDVELWGQAVERERLARRTLQAVSDNWDDVVDQYEGES